MLAVANKRARLLFAEIRCSFRVFGVSVIGGRPTGKGLDVEQGRAGVVREPRTVRCVGHKLSPVVQRVWRHNNVSIPRVNSHRYEYVNARIHYA
jgi:hypothetical protein